MNASMMSAEPKIHFNVGGPRGWTTACGIESASFVERHKVDDHDLVDCKSCLRAMARSQQSSVAKGGEK